MPELADSTNSPGGTQPLYGGVTDGYAGAQGRYSNTDYKSPHMGGGGGPPFAEVYTPGNGLQKAGYSGFVPSHMELPEAPPRYSTNPSTPYSYPITSDQDREGAAEMM